jgi:predicted phosphodiesterase
MRIAAIYDIHANLPALEAVLQEIGQIGVDRIVVGGDVVPGPMPGPTLAALLELNIPVDFIQGNGEVAVLQLLAGEEPAGVPQQFRPIIEWTVRQLNAEQEQLLRGWPRTIGFELQPLGQILFCHGTPRDANEIFTRLTPEDRLRPVFEGVDANVVVCGHTHMQFDRTIGGRRIVNAGSVGMPFGKPGAYWLLLDADIEFQRTEYDLQSAANRIRASDYPQAEQFAANYILNLPSEEQMLDLFSW